MEEDMGMVIYTLGCQVKYYINESCYIVVQFFYM